MSFSEGVLVSLFLIVVVFALLTSIFVLIRVMSAFILRKVPEQ